MVTNAVLELLPNGRYMVKINGTPLMEDGEIHTFSDEWSVMSYLDRAVKLTLEKYNVQIGFVLHFTPKKRASVRQKVIGDPGLTPDLYGYHEWTLFSTYENRNTGAVNYTFKCPHCGDRVEAVTEAPVPALCPGNLLQ